MYLKSIEIQGFKSFANKIKLDFHNGITGIVGPNGSGKSNIADAVRWVLGEQRIKQLRGGSMQDVIFSGTENRKPLSYASVAITLDNSDHKLPIDYEEVTVTRKLFRSGESDYQLNGHSCRLKDINELFYDTGIGKEGYSIIGQGQIDKILSGKPEERRELFDEAAGIVKFKRRKEASLKKLTDERANLVRVTDILSELEIQVEPLKKQSEKAKEYLTKKEELKRFDINSFLLENERINDLKAEIIKNLEISRTDRETTSKQKDEMKAKYEAIEQELLKVESEVEEAKNQLNETTLLKQQLESQIELIKEQIKSAKQNDEHFDERKKALDLEISTRETLLSELLLDKADLEEKLAKRKEKETLIEKELTGIRNNVVALSSQIEGSKSEIIKLLNNRASTRSDIGKFDTLKEQLVKEKEQRKNKITENEESLAKEEKNLISEQELLDNITKTIAEKAQKITVYETEIHQISEKLNKLTARFNLGQTTYLREQSRLESMENITERYEGYSNSIKKVMEQKSREPGIIGVVADIIKVNKDYEIAIETALGGSVQNIVTTNPEVAKKMISFLKTNKFGRATFLPLATIKANSDLRKSPALKEEGAIGIASDLAIVDEKFKGLCDYLLGRTLVVKTIDNGILIAKKYHQSIRIVTLEGELINPGGTMTGGAFKNSSHLLSRRREIAEAKKAVSLLKKELDDVGLAVKTLKKEKTEKFAYVDEKNNELKEDYVKQNTLEMNVEASSERILRAKERIKENKDSLTTISRQLETILLDQESIQVELDTSQSLENELNEKIKNSEKELKNIQEQEVTKQKELEEMHLEYASTIKELNFNIENVTRIKEEEEKYREELAELVNSRQG
ncbi:MAG TPA: chromosome segregation protein SMC, partial [Candidatus Dorea intestinavium]|nr:chromosome segregation protein SMC [Candidatus Dorea intestinavium]